MKSRNIYLSAKGFLDAKEAATLGIISHHIDATTELIQDRNNSMYKIGLSSTVEFR
jgi:hypothetical protein